MAATKEKRGFKTNRESSSNVVNATGWAKTGTASAAGGTHTATATWRDWQPDDTPEPPIEEMLTRQDLSRLLADRGTPVSEHTLLEWEQAGLLPRSTRRRKEGATRGLYAYWVYHVASMIADLSASGLPRAEILKYIDERRNSEESPLTWQARPWETSASRLSLPLTDMLVASREMGNVFREWNQGHLFRKAKLTFIGDDGEEELAFIYAWREDDRDEELVVGDVLSKAHLRIYDSE